jgi:hypothetical protein
MRSMKWVAVLIVGALLVVGLGGCSCVSNQIAKTAVQNATGVKVNEGGKSVTVTGKNGQTATLSSQEGKLPEGLPSDVPAYSGTIKSSAAISTDKGTNYTFTIDTNDTVSTVAGWYKDQLTAKGWTVSQTIQAGPDQAMVQAKKTPNTSIIVTVGKKSEGGTEIATIVDVGK